MVKIKKKNLSEFAQQKRAQKSKKQLNPFEVHINRDKQNVLGRKNKNDRGLPGVSRAKAINKRKQSLLQEYKLKNKDNVFLDKRIGEKSSTMSTEDKAMARFAMERMKMHKKKNIFNLNDDEVLTHRGQTLEEIEKFDDPKSDDEYSDNENSGKLDRNFVEEAHFGGGVLSKPNSALSRKDLIDQLIAESKKRKAEKQKIREQTIDLTEKLDSEWKDLLPIISASKKSEKDDNETVKADAYDTAVRQLIFEARGNPSDKLKSEEEIIQEEKKRLEELEADRLARMKGFVSDTSNKYKHKSADDLDDGFIMEAVVDDSDDNDINSVPNDANDISNEEDSNVDNNEINDNDISDEQKRNKPKNIAEKNKIKTREDDSENRERTCSESSNDKNEAEIDLNNKDSEIEESDGEESEDSLLDLKVSDTCSEDEENKTIEKHVKFANNLINGQITQTNQLDQNCPKSILKQNNNNTSIQNLSDKDKKQEIRNDLLRRKEIMEKAREELPYTYNAPENFEELQKLLENHNADYQSVIIDRIIKCNHWTLNGKNKEKMSNLFVYLLQHINNCASTENADDLVKCFQIFDR